ncbi:MAG TPA: 2-isopropylmalate synthase [Terriglobales bacterium]|jgi:2-isopropylmalate synthase|nr:2-isopropylmalate synthase [Terriglobales bacterium]
MDRPRITIFDTTLRDGEQSPGCSMNVQEKVRLALQLDRLGVDVIEAGFPIASDGDFEAVERISATVRRPIIAGLARACKGDVDRAWQALQGAAHPRIHIFLATSDIHLQYKLRITREQCLEQAREAVAHAKSLCDDVEFSPEDATRTDVGFLCQVVEAVIAAGATTVNIPDTVGYSMPEEYGQLIRTLQEKVAGIEKVTISTHCHNDLGLAVANSLAGVQQGARQVECTINGIGERAGNASLEEIVMAMRVRRDRYPYENAVASEHLFAASQMLAEITRVPVQPNKAITGRNAFAHEAGIHQDGMLKNPLTYEIMTPQSVGVPDSRLVLGKHSGRHALALRCEQLGHQFERRELDEIYRRFVVLADRIKKVQDGHLLELIRDVVEGNASNGSEVSSTGKKFPPATASLPVPRAAAVAASSSDAHVAQIAGSAGQATVKIPLGDHHGEQEDYLWGV